MIADDVLPLQAYTQTTNKVQLLVKDKWKYTEE